MNVTVCVCECVCVRERESESARVCEYVCLCDFFCPSGSVVCVLVCVCVCVRVCVLEREIAKRCDIEMVLLTQLDRCECVCV